MPWRGFTFAVAACATILIQPSTPSHTRIPVYHLVTAPMSRQYATLACTVFAIATTLPVLAGDEPRAVYPQPQIYRLVPVVIKSESRGTNFKAIAPRVVPAPAVTVTVGVRRTDGNLTTACVQAPNLQPLSAWIQAAAQSVELPQP